MVQRYLTKKYRYRRGVKVRCRHRRVVGVDAETRVLRNLLPTHFAGYRVFVDPNIKGDAVYLHEGCSIPRWGFHAEPTMFLGKQAAWDLVHSKQVAVPMPFVGWCIDPS